MKNIGFTNKFKSCRR